MEFQQVREEESGSEERSSLTIAETFIYMLGNKLGGRKEVLEMPAVELIGMMDAHRIDAEQEAQREKAKAYLQFLIQSYTAPSFGKQDAAYERDKKEFVESLKPDHMKKKAIEHNGPAIVYDWDAEVMKRMKEQLEGG